MYKRQILSHTAGLSQEKLDDCVHRLRACNPAAPIVTTEWDQLTGAQLLEAMTQKNTLDDELQQLLAEQQEHHHHDHEHEEHEHHHDHDHEEHEHHHEHDHEEHEHHHDHDCCGHDHHHHHADEVFTSWGKETPKKFTEEGIRAILDTLSKEDSDEYGIILRAKGIVPDENGKWIHFDLVPGEDEVRYGSAEYTGRICVIGSKVNEDKLAELFGL